METITSLRCMLLVYVSLVLGLCIGMQGVKSTSQNNITSLIGVQNHTALNHTDSLISNIDVNYTASSISLPNHTSVNYTEVAFKDQKDNGGGSSGGGFSWGWGGGGGGGIGGGGGGGGGGGSGGWGWGGGGEGWYKWGPCGRGRKRGNRRYERGYYKIGEYAQCMGEGRCKWERLDCPLHCSGNCFYDCLHMCKAHCRL